MSLRTIADETARWMLADLKATFREIPAPAGENLLYLMEKSTVLGKWVAGLGGVTIAIAISFSGSAYVSFIQVAKECYAQLLAADAIRGGGTLALCGTIGASLALAGLVLPEFARQLWLALGMRKAGKQGTPDPTLHDWQVSKFIAIVQIGLILLGFCFVIAVPLGTLSTIKELTSEKLAHTAKSAEKVCSPTPN